MASEFLLLWLNLYRQTGMRGSKETVDKQSHGGRFVLGNKNRRSIPFRENSRNA
jgi:hypothetical protein